MLKSLLIVGLGGFIGTVLRFLVQRAFQFPENYSFPWATFLINILGSFAIGIVYGLSEKSDLLSSEWRLFLTVGLCGGFTTFSTFSNDALILVQAKEWIRVSLYAGLSLFLGLGAAYLGRIIIMKS
jgi:fluoride exporter